MRISGGKALHTEGSASAKAQRQSLTHLFKEFQAGGAEQAH